MSALSTSMCLLTTLRYNKEKCSVEASEKMLVNLEEFNHRLSAHGSESKLQVSIPAYYIAHMKGATLSIIRTVETHNRPHKWPQTHKWSKTRVHTTDTQTCSRCASLSWLAGRRDSEKRLYNICADVIMRPNKLALQPHLFIR